MRVAAGQDRKVLIKAQGQIATKRSVGLRPALRVKTIIRSAGRRPTLHVKTMFRSAGRRPILRARVGDPRYSLGFFMDSR